MPGSYESELAEAIEHGAREHGAVTLSGEDAEAAARALRFVALLAGTDEGEGVVEISEGRTLTFETQPPRRRAIRI